MDPKGGLTESHVGMNEVRNDRALQRQNNATLELPTIPESDLAHEDTLNTEEFYAELVAQGILRADDKDAVEYLMREARRFGKQKACKGLSDAAYTKRARMVAMVINRLLAHLPAERTMLANPLSDGP